MTPTKTPRRAPMKTTPKRVTPRQYAMKESDFLKRIVDLAEKQGWMCAHFLPTQIRAGRWVTAMHGHAGFPDLVLARGGRVILAELKTETGIPGPMQHQWLRYLGPHGRLWRPSDWDTIVKELA